MSEVSPDCSLPSPRVLLTVLSLGAGARAFQDGQEAFGEQQAPGHRPKTLGRPHWHLDLSPTSLTSAPSRNQAATGTKVLDSKVTGLQG